MCMCLYIYIYIHVCIWYRIYFLRKPCLFRISMFIHWRVPVYQGLPCFRVGLFSFNVPWIHRMSGKVEASCQDWLGATGLLDPKGGSLVLKREAALVWHPFLYANKGNVFFCTTPTSAPWANRNPICWWITGPAADDWLDWCSQILGRALALLIIDLLIYVYSHIYVYIYTYIYIYTCSRYMYVCIYNYYIYVYIYICILM